MFQNLCRDSIAKPFTHDGDVVGVAEHTDDCACIAMSLLIRGETWRVCQSLLDGSDVRTSAGYTQSGCPLRLRLDPRGARLEPCLSTAIR